MSVCSWHTLCVRSLPAVETMQAYITVAGTAPALNPNRQRDCDNCCSPWRQSPMLNRMLFPSSRPFNTIIWPPFPGLLVLLSLSDIIFFQPSRSYPRGSLDKVTIIAAFLLHHYFDFCDLLGGSSDFRFSSFRLSFFPSLFPFPVFFSFVSRLANMSAEGQEIREERVEEPTTTATLQEEGGDDEVCLFL